MTGLEEQLSRDLELTGAIEGSGGGVDDAEGSRRDERSYTSIGVTADRACNAGSRRSGEAVSGCGDTQTVAVVHKVECLTEYLEPDSFVDAKVTRDTGVEIVNTGTGEAVASDLWSPAKGAAGGVEGIVGASGSTTVVAGSCSKRTGARCVDSRTGVVGHERGYGKAGLLRGCACDEPAVDGGVQEMVGECECGRVDETGNEAVAHVEIGSSLFTSHVDPWVGVDLFAVNGSSRTSVPKKAPPELFAPEAPPALWPASVVCAQV